MIFAHAVDIVLDQFPGSVTSWYRTPKRNKLVGGAIDSKHLLGLAVDVIFDNELPPAKFLRRLGLRSLVEQDHIHIEEMW